VLPKKVPNFICELALYPELSVLQALREQLRCKEIWVVGANRYRQSLEVYSRLLIGEAQKEYDGVMGKFPV
jgi:hypothetical protein